MHPKKKSPMGPILAAFGLIFAIYVALHAGVVAESVAIMLANGDIAHNEQATTFLTMLLARMENESNVIQFTQYTPKWLFYCGFAWFMIVLMIASNKKNYIHGKEFGEARWGTIADIRDLFASVIEREEIKKAKRIRNPIGRLILKANVYKRCKKDGQQLLKLKMKELALQEEINRSEGKGNRRLYKEKQKQIQKEVRETVERAKNFEWKPNRLKLDYEKRKAEIDESKLFSEEEKKHQKQLAKQEYEKEKKAFYDYSVRVVAIRKKYLDADMLFTKTERISFYNFVLNNNTLILGGSGSGKTRGFVMPNILQAHSSYIITDPKGEILEKAGYFLSKIKGYKIRVLNLDEKADSDGYNPFVYIHPEREGYEERVLDLIETIIINTDGGEKKSGSDPFWPMAERLFLQSIFFFVADGFVEEERNMNTVHKLISMLQIGEEEDNRDSDLDIFAQIFAEKFGEDHIGVQQYNEFRSKSSGKTAKSVVISAVARLAPFKTADVRKIFSQDTMDLDRVGEEKTAIFVVVPPTTTTFNFVAGMLFTQLFQELQYCATQVHKHEGQRLPVPVRFILDEFANTCTIPNFVKILAYARSFGIGITVILQSLEQIKNMYKDEWGVIVDNCNTLLYLGSITHDGTLEYMSKLLGKGTFDKQTTGLTRGRNGSSSKNEDVVGRELMMPSDIREMPKKDCLLVVGGRPAFYSEKYEYKEHPNYRFTSDANKAFSFDIKKYRAEMAAEAEKARAAQEEETSYVEEVLTPSEASHVNIDMIGVEMDPNAILADMAQNSGRLKIIPDEDLNVPDGEPTEQRIIEKTLDELVDDAAAAREDAKATVAMLTVSEETKNVLGEARKNRIVVEENLLHIVQGLGRTFRDLHPIPDDETMVDDGEGTAELDAKFEEYVLEDSDDSVDDAQDLADAMAEIEEVAGLTGFDDLSDAFSDESGV